MFPQATQVRPATTFINDIDPLAQPKNAPSANRSCQLPCPETITGVSHCLTAADSLNHDDPDCVTFSTHRVYSNRLRFLHAAQ